MNANIINNSLPPPTNYGMMPNGSISPSSSISSVINDPSEIIEYSNELTYWSRRTKDIEKYNNLTNEQRQTLRELNQKIMDTKKILITPTQQQILRSSAEIARSKPIPIPGGKSLRNSKPPETITSENRNSDNTNKQSTPGSPRAEDSSSPGSGSGSKSNSRRNSGRLKREFSNKIKRINSDDDEIKLGLAIMKAMKYLEQEQKDK